MRVLVAPDKFKGTLSAEQAARAIAAGWLQAVPDATMDVVPMADGGDGTLEAMVAALGGELRRVEVSGPLGDRVEAQYAFVPGRIAVIEMARASGLGLLSPGRRDPKRTSSRGTGELILAACREGAESILVGIGGSATNDAGAGMAQALGVRLIDEQGRDIPQGGSGLLHLARIDTSGLDPAVRRARVTVATDVNNPLVGPSGASAVYGPQKGATPEDVLLLDHALGHFAAVVYRDLGVDLRHVPGAGAAGGLGAGLIAFLGARLRPGVDVVMDAVGLPARLDAADVAVTGEGKFDQQTLHGKAPAGVLRAAADRGVPAIVLCGELEAYPSGVRAYSLAERFGVDEARARPALLLERLAAFAATEFRDGVDGRGR
jgi:glycerate kinase